MNDLLPCPFCGGKASWANDDDFEDWIPQCTVVGCWCTLGAYPTEAKAVAKWNTRTETAPIAVPILGSVTWDTGAIRWTRTETPGGWRKVWRSGKTQRRFDAPKQDTQTQERTMQTNSPAQQTTRRMTPAQKAATLALRIAADTAERQAHEAKFRATRELWQTAERAGLTPAQMHDIDMELMHGADVAALLADLRQF